MKKKRHSLRLKLLITLNVTASVLCLIASILLFIQNKKECMYSITLMLANIYFAITEMIECETKNSKREN